MHQTGRSKSGPGGQCQDPDGNWWYSVLHRCPAKVNVPVSPGLKSHRLNWQGTRDLQQAKNEMDQAEQDRPAAVYCGFQRWPNTRVTCGL
jgi:hypothetical protein